MPKCACERQIKLKPGDLARFTNQQPLVVGNKTYCACVCRSKYVKGYLALAVPYGGAVPAVSSRISGQLVGMPWLTSQLLGLSVDEAIYSSTWGQPSVVMLLPYSNALPSSTVRSKPLTAELVQQLAEQHPELVQQQTEVYRQQDLQTAGASSGYKQHAWLRRMHAGSCHAAMHNYTHPSHSLHSLQGIHACHVGVLRRCWCRPPHAATRLHSCSS
jgi:hypothetical protein